MATGSLFLKISNAAGAELVLPNMKTRLLQSSGHTGAYEVSRPRSLFEGTPLVHSRWLDDGFPTLSFEAIARLRKSDEFKLFANDLGSVKDLPIDEGRAKLQLALSTYLSAIAHEIGKTHIQPERVSQEHRMTNLARASRWGGYSTAPIGGATSALTLISPSLTFTPLLGVALAAVGMIFTGKFLSRKAATIHSEITEAGMETNLLMPTPVSVADLVARL